MVLFLQSDSSPTRKDESNSGNLLVRTYYK